VNRGEERAQKDIGGGEIMESSGLFCLEQMQEENQESNRLFQV